MGIRLKVKRALKFFQLEVKTPVYVPVFSGNLLTGKMILITGGTGGIGCSIASACLRNGASVIVAGRNFQKLSEITIELEHYKISCEQRIVPMILDIQNVKCIRTSIDTLIHTNNIERIDVLVNNAGVSAGQIIGQTKEDDFDKTIDTNLKGTYFMAQEFSNYLVENEIQGNILNISSVSGIRPVITPYMLSKWGITGLTEGLAKRLIKNGIVVNGIAPGPTTTEMLYLDGTNLHYECSPSKRFIDPVEISNLAVFLISNMGRMIVGDTVYITGGCGNLTIDDIKY